ncbi:MAG: hypothetical protein A2X86_01980 [Bdellovibrionales bacterium GWA2_49_15]|nr:MAG: hypothetical protein A2X86_01980 [Bdellovibrionales bacterium GWA2_49_15]
MTTSHHFSVIRSLNATLLIICVWCLNLTVTNRALAQIPTPPPSFPTSIPTIPPGGATCVPDTGPVACANGVTQKQLADVRALLAGEPANVIEAKVQEICNDPGVTAQKLACLMNPVPLPPELQPPSELELPESLQRRLIMNNQVSKITPDQWPSWAKDLSMGNVPPGIDPYFPEEREALLALGFTEEDLKKLPPGGERLNEVLNQYASEQYENVKGMAISYSGGYLFGVALVIAYAVFGALPIFLRCKSMPSSIIFFTSSMVYIVKVLATLATYLDTISTIADTMEGKPAEQLKAGIEEYKRAIKQGKAFAKDGEAMVDRGEDLYDMCKSMGYDAAQISNCVNTANQFGVDAETLKNRGVEWLNCEMDRVKQASADQFAMIDHVYQVMKTMKTLVLTEAISTTVISAAWGVSAGFAIAEAVNPTTGFGSCVAQYVPPAPQENKKMFTQFMQNFLGMQKAFAGMENAEEEFSSAGFNWLFIILAAAGVWLTLTAAVITSAINGVNVGTMRALFLGAAAIQAIIGMGFLWSAYSYTSDLLDQLTILRRAMQRTLRNEGVSLESGDWTKAQEHLGVKDMKAEDRDKFDPCTKKALDNNPTQTATPIPSPPGGWPTIPPGATIPPGLPTPPGSSFLWPGMDGKENILQRPWRNLFTEKWHAIIKDLMGQNFVSSAYAQTPKQKSKRTDSYCITNNKFQPDYGCDCRQTGSCFTPNTLSFKIDKRIDPKGMKNHVSLYRDVNKAMDLLSQDRMAEVQHLTKNFPQRIDSLKKEQVYLNKVLNQSLAAKKKPSINIEADAKNLNQHLQKQFEKKVNSLPAKDRNRALGIMSGASTPPKGTEEALARKDNLLSKGIKSLAKFLSSLGPLGKKRYPSQAKGKKDHNGDEVFSDFAAVDWSDAGVVDSEGVAPPGEDTLEEYEIQESDIIQDKAASLFQIISNRYLKRFMDAK